MDYRHFELQDLVSEALIALESRNYDTAAATLKKLLAWIESDWLATPTDINQTPPPAFAPETAGGNNEDDDSAASNAEAPTSSTSRREDNNETAN